MKNADMEQMLPTAGASGRLLAGAVHAGGQEVPREELARRNGVSRLALSAAMNKLLDSGLVVESPAGVRFVRDHPLAGLAEQVVLTLLGVVPRPPEIDRAAYLRRIGSPPPNIDYLYGRLVPDVLREGVEDDLGDGPTLVEARVQCQRLHPAL